MRLQTEFVRAQFRQATGQSNQLTGGVVAASKERPDVI